MCSQKVQGKPHTPHIVVQYSRINSLYLPKSSWA